MRSGKRDEDWERWVRYALRGPHLHEAPDVVIRRALALGRRLASRGSAAIGEWLVELLFDSAAQPLPAGVRGVASGPRRLLYRACRGADEELQLDLRVRRESAGTFQLTGQFLPPGGPGHVEVVSGSARRRKTLGSAGEFLFRDLPAGSAALRLEILRGGDRMVIEDVPLPDEEREAP